jgi:hypothetical protein
MAHGHDDMAGFDVTAIGQMQAAQLAVLPSPAMSKPLTRVLKRYSPPSFSMVSRMLITIVTRRKVPICGCAS